MVDGKIYDLSLSQTELKKCPTDGPDGPQWMAETLIFEIRYNLAYVVSERVCIASCEETSKCEQKCKTDPEWVSRHQKAGMDMVFDHVRNRPPAHAHAACEEFRAVCEKVCLSKLTYSQRRCTIECNQYPTWNPNQ